MIIGRAHYMGDQMTRTAIATAAVGVLALLAGCGGEPQPIPTVTVEATVTTTARATVTATVTVTPEPSATQASPSDDGGVVITNVTEVVKAAVGGNALLVESAEQEGEAGHMEIQTTILDPRGEDGSAAAAKAVAICEAVVAELAPAGLRVLEGDGSTFVAWMENAPAGYESRTCFEY